MPSAEAAGKGRSAPHTQAKFQEDSDSESEDSEGETDDEMPQLLPLKGAIRSCAHVQRCRHGRVCAGAAAPACASMCYRVKRLRRRDHDMKASQHLRRKRVLGGLACRR